MTEILYIPIIIAALFHGITSSLHCISMCGPFIAAMNHSPDSKIRTNLFYHSGRGISYMIIGFSLGYFGKGINFAGDLVHLQMISAVFAGIFILIFAMGIFVPSLSKTGTAIPSVFLKRIFSPVLMKLKTSSNPSLYSLVFGFFTGILPCGVLYPAFALAFASGDPVQGSIFMGAFFTGTLPGLFLFTMGFNQFRGKLNPQLIKALGILFIIIGIGTIFVRFHHDHSTMHPTDDKTHHHIH
ncbi:MAG: sulfite exporter TauE/SafE family protein [Leptospira sp.]|nr:sulfite exporter TauE/SafE family protein [Leptospira sp.]